MAWAGMDGGGHGAAGLSRGDPFPHSRLVHPEPRVTAGARGGPTITCPRCGVAVTPCVAGGVGGVGVTCLQ